MAKAFFRLNLSHSVDAVTAQTLADAGATAGQIAGCEMLTVTSTADINYLVGSTPTATFGHTIKAEETNEFPQAAFADMEFLSQSGTATVTFTLEGYA